MERSENINELVAALAKAQSEFTPAKKDTVNPYYSSKYADLAEIMAATMPALSKNGLSVVQFPIVNYENKMAGVDAVLAHSSGQFMSTSLILPAVMKSKDGTLRFDAQSIGAAITYARRYTYQPLVGIAAEVDDDANSISVGANGSKETAQEVGARRVQEVKAKIAAQKGESKGEPAGEVYGLLRAAKKIKLKNNKGDALALEILDPNDKAVALFCFDNRKYPDGSSLFDLLEMAAEGKGQSVRLRTKASGKFTNVIAPIAIGSVTFDADGVPEIQREG